MKERETIDIDPLRKQNSTPTTSPYEINKKIVRYRLLKNLVRSISFLYLVLTELSICLNRPTKENKTLSYIIKRFLKIVPRIIVLYHLN